MDEPSKHVSPSDPAGMGESILGVWPRWSGVRQHGDQGLAQITGDIRLKLTLPVEVIDPGALSALSPRTSSIAARLKEAKRPSGSNVPHEGEGSYEEADVGVAWST